MSGITTNLDEEILGEIANPLQKLNEPRSQKNTFVYNVIFYSLLFTYGALYPYYILGFGLSDNSTTSTQTRVPVNYTIAFYLGLLPAGAQLAFYGLEALDGKPLITIPILTNLTVFAACRLRNRKQRLENMVRAGGR